MNNQSLILLAIGLFMSLIVAVAAVDQYLFDEHPPGEADGLIWRVENAFSRIKDLDALVEVSEGTSGSTSVRMVVRMLNRLPVALSVRYLGPTDLEGQIFTVENDQLSHYIPDAGMIIVKRWVGVPLAAVGLASLDLSQLRAERDAGNLELRVLQNVPTFTPDLFATTVTLTGTLTHPVSEDPLSLCSSACPDDVDPSFCSGTCADDVIPVTFAGASATGSAIRSEYILEVRDAETGELTRMVWIDRESYFVQKVVFFSDGQRTKTVQLKRITVDKGLTPEEVLTLPRGVEIVRG